MQTEMHIGFRWELTKDDISELERRVIELHGYEDIKTKTCINGHIQEDGKFCKICGSELKTNTSTKIIDDFEWWTVFDENCFYNTGTTIYLSIDSGYIVLDTDDLTSLDNPNDELSELLNSFATPIACAFVFPWIYDCDPDGEDDE